MTHARRYVVSSQLWLTIVSCRVASSVRRNKTWPCANFRKRAGKTPVTAAFRIDDSKRLGSRRVTPMCAVHTSFLLTLLTMSNTIGFAKKRVINKTAVPTMFPSKRAVSQRSLSQPLDAEGRLGPRPSSRAGQRMAHASKQVFVN